jgi:hypothetical protein
VTIKDIGPQPQAFDLEHAPFENQNYRTVAWSGRYMQVTLMSIPAVRSRMALIDDRRHTPSPNSGGGGHGVHPTTT